MSLLMKALANAEENKRVLSQRVQQEDSQQQQAAANIFTASQNPNTSFSILINGLIVLIVIGIFWFSYKLYQLNQIPSNLAVTTLPTQLPMTQGKLLPEPAAGQIQTTMVSSEPKVTDSANNSEKIIASLPKAKKSKAKAKVNTKTITKQAQRVEPEPINTVVTGKIDAFSDAQGLEDSQASTTAQATSKSQIGPSQIKVEHKAGNVVLDQRLQNAYQAFVSGNPSEAKSLYRDVLKQDIYQTDALLGMAAIAQKQGRYADAAGWYQKALATEPNNPDALAGLAATSPQPDAHSQALRLQKLIRKQPYHAQHYANLGNLYASQRAWTKAQAAFFEANRHDKHNAQFAFNLAVSLEHLGKPSLAIQHYQRALALVKSQNLSVPNSTQIQQRLDVLQ